MRRTIAELHELLRLRGINPDGPWMQEALSRAEMEKMEAKMKPREKMLSCAKAIEDLLAEPEYSSYNVERQARMIVRWCQKERSETTSPLEGLTLEELKNKFFVAALAHPSSRDTEGESSRQPRRTKVDS